MIHLKHIHPSFQHAEMLWTHKETDGTQRSKHGHGSWQVSLSLFLILRFSQKTHICLTIKRITGVHRLDLYLLVCPGAGVSEDVPKSIQLHRVDIRAVNTFKAVIGSSTVSETRSVLTLLTVSMSTCTAIFHYFTLL